MLNNIEENRLNIATAVGVYEQSTKIVFASPVTMLPCPLSHNKHNCVVFVLCFFLCFLDFAFVL